MTSRPRFFAPEAGRDESPLTLPADESHHLTHVLRLGPGAEIAVFDGRGSEWAARVVSVRRHRATVELGSERAPTPEPAVSVTLGVALLKGDQMDAVVRDATTLGAARLIVLATEHVAVSSRAARGSAMVARWRRVAVAAAKQCRRAVVPDIEAIVPFATALAQAPELVLMAVEPDTGVRDAAALRDLARPRSALALVGPEGGWSQAEVAAARERHAVFLSLGPRTLRAESTPVVLLSALWTTWGW